MKTLDELRQCCTPLQVPFACNSKDKTTTGDSSTPENNLPISSEDGANFEYGFPHRFSKSPKTESDTGLYILRKDMNRIGEMSTRELFSKQIGIAHTYDKTVVDYSMGYPLRGVLSYDDGINVKNLESQVPANDVSFVDKPNVIDSFSRNNNNKREIFWKTVSLVYGIDNGLIRIVPDFSRQEATPFSSNPSIKVKADSLVTVSGFSCDIGSTSNAHTLSITVKKEDEDSTPVTINVPNIGKTGYSTAAWPIILLNRMLAAPWFTSVNGTADYYVSFFAKKGYVVSASIGQRPLNGFQISVSPLMTLFTSEENYNAV